MPKMTSFSSAKVENYRAARPRRLILHPISNAARAMEIFPPTVGLGRARDIGSSVDLTAVVESLELRR